ncbi:LysR substrate-binding domain-containing protein [Paraburkholderia phytofirmans]|uniref:LysR substrate-binding domain-containing protein n=1 Tax=Paraburkholderia phytofirmans TaxID=261302 RepID=UPI0009ED2793
MRTTLHSLESPAQVQLLRHRELDACIVRTVAGNVGEVDRILLLREKLVVALPEKHVLAAKGEIRTRELATDFCTAPHFDKDTPPPDDWSAGRIYS